MIKFENHLGAIEISQDYFANLGSAMLPPSASALPVW